MLIVQKLASTAYTYNYFPPLMLGVLLFGRASRENQIGPKTENISGSVSVSVCVCVSAVNW